MSNNNKTTRFIPFIIALSIVGGILIGTFYSKHYGGKWKILFYKIII